MADVVSITITAKDGATKTFQAVGNAAQKMGEQVEGAGAKGAAGLEKTAAGAEKASSSFLKLDSSGSGAIRTIGDAASAADRAGDSFIQMGSGLQTISTMMGDWSQSARDQQQTLTGLKSAFGDASDEMIKFADEMAKTTIFNDDDILAGERYFASLKNNYDLSTEQIQQLMQTTADLASASGVSFEDASSRVTAAIRGEGEAAEYLGLTMNQQSIDRNNLTLTMSNQEAAQFRLNALYQQAAAYEGNAQQVAQSRVGAYAAVTNQIEDLQQAVGGTIGPWASLISSFGGGITSIGETIRGVGEIKTGLTSLNTVVRGTQLGMTALTLATGPLGLTLAGIGVALGAATLLWREHTKAAREAQEAWQDYGKAVQTVDDTILNEKLSGDPALAKRMESTAKLIRDGVAEGVSAAQAEVEQSKINFDSLFEGDVETVRANVNTFLSDGIGKAAIDWARDTHDFDYAVDVLTRSTFTDAEGAKNTLKPIMDAYWAQLTPTDADATKIEEDINKVFQLMSSPNIDQDKLWEGVQKIHDELVKTGDVDAAHASFAALFNDLIAGAGNATSAVDDLTTATEKLNAEIKRSAEYALASGDAIAEMYRASNEKYPEGDEERRLKAAQERRDLLHQELLALTAAGGDPAAIESLTGELAAANTEAENLEATLSRIAVLTAVQGDKKNIGTQGILESGFTNVNEREANRQRQRDFMSEITLGPAGQQTVAWMGAVATSSAQATAAIEAGAAATTAWSKAAENTAEQMEKIAEAEKKAISQWQEMTGNDDFVSQLNLAGLGNEFTELAGDITDAGNAVDTVFRVIVGNTNAIKSQAEGVKSWADELINVRGEYGRIDDLMSEDTAKNPYGKALLSPEQYEAAQNAYDSIAISTAKIGVNVDAIQAMQSGFIAGFLEDQSDLLENLRQQDEAQQRITLGWMDTTSAMQAQQVVAMAASAANGELGASGKKATQEMIEGLVAVNPFMEDMLTSIGLISRDHQGNIVVNFEGAESTQATLDDINTSILTLADVLDNGKLDGSIDIAVKNREEIEAAAAAAEKLASYGGTTVTITVNAGKNAADSFLKDLTLTDGTVVKVPAELDVQDWTVTPEEWAKAKDLQVDVKGVIKDLTTEVGDELPPQPVKGEVTSIEASPEVGDGTGGPTVPVRAHLVWETEDNRPDSSTAAGSGQSLATPIEQTVTITADNSDALSKIGEVQSAAEKLGGTTATATLGVNASAAVIGIYNAQTQADNFGATSKNATIGVYDNASETIRGVISLMDSVASKTVALNVVTTYSSVGSPSGYSSGSDRMFGGVAGYADGGTVDIRAGERDPEWIDYPSGGGMWAMTDGIYSVPKGSYVNTAPASRGLAAPGGLTVNLIVQGDVNGIEDLQAKAGIAFAQAYMGEYQRYAHEQGVD